MSGLSQSRGGRVAKPLFLDSDASHLKSVDYGRTLWRNFDIILLPGDENAGRNDDGTVTVSDIFCSLEVLALT